MVKIMFVLRKSWQQNSMANVTESQKSTRVLMGKDAVKRLSAGISNWCPN